MEVGSVWDAAGIHEAACTNITDEPFDYKQQAGSPLFVPIFKPWQLIIPSHDAGATITAKSTEMSQNGCFTSKKVDKAKSSLAYIEPST